MHRSLKVRTAQGVACPIYGLGIFVYELDGLMVLAEAILARVIPADLVERRNDRLWFLVVMQENSKLLHGTSGRLLRFDENASCMLKYSEYTSCVCA